MHSDQSLHDGEVAILSSQMETGVVGAVQGAGGVCSITDDVTNNPAQTCMWRKEVKYIKACASKTNCQLRIIACSM